MSIIDSGAVTAALATAASGRLLPGFKPTNLAAYKMMFYYLLALLILSDLWLPRVSTTDVFNCFRLVVLLLISKIISQLSGLLVLYITVIPALLEISGYLCLRRQLRSIDP